MSSLAAIQDWILVHAGSWWSYVVTAGLCWIDGFFPPLPSESVVIAMASLALQDGAVSLWVLVPLVLVGAWLGDNTAYWIGRVVPLHRIFNGERGTRVLAQAERLLQRKGPEVLLSARFIPIYRVAINMTAGAVRYPWGRFALIDVASTLAWAAFIIGVGSAAGAVFRGHPLLGIAAGVLVGLALGWVIDKVGTRLRERGGSGTD